MNVGKLFTQTLARLGLIHRQTRDDYINAQNEEAVRSYEKATVALRNAIAQHTRGSNALRHSIRVARSRTNSFADFERMAVRKEEMK
jgi:hypothetical protein